MADIAKRFKRDIADHDLEIVHDDGLYRHLKFRHQGSNYSSYCWFDLITVPGSLIFRGDGESYVFARMPDMFEFFRSSAYQGKPNLGYWAEKLTSDDNRIKRYDEQLFCDAVAEELKQHFGEQPVPDDLLKAVQEEVLESEYLATADDALRTVGEFSYYENEDDRWKHDKHPDFVFDHPWEWPIRDYDWWFVWACHAIVWGIAKYDAERPKPSAWRRSIRLMLGRGGARG